MFVRGAPTATTSRKRACVGQTGRFAVGRCSTWCSASAAPTATADRERICVVQKGRFAVGRCSASCSASGLVDRDHAMPNRVVSCGFVLPDTVMHGAMQPASTR